MRSQQSIVVALAALAAFAQPSDLRAADTAPTDIQMPGTQPGEVGNLESPNKCDNCHGGYNTAVEPAFTWRGSMMANAGRDPIFWATLAIAEQDFDGVGDLCIRCHSTAGWLAGRSTPTDGSGLAAGDADGVECDFCHKLTNPDNSEHLGTQFDVFIANDGHNTEPGSEGYYGSGMASLWSGTEKLGPYDDAGARHQFSKSSFHRSVDFCGTCHDVSNPVVGDLAPNHGIQATADAIAFSGILGGPVADKAAFNNMPYEYGIVERTFSEYKSGDWPQTLVSSYPSLPAELQAGAPKAGYDSAIVAGTGGNYADGEPRYYSCQTCHMRPVNGQGCNKKGVAARTDLALHDMTGGNYWMPDAIRYLDQLGKLRLGGGMTADQLGAMDDGKLRAIKQLNEAAVLLWDDPDPDTLRIVNLAGHKLITGYPEGRRMWLHVTWYDADVNVVREDGEYGSILVELDGVPTYVDSIVDSSHSYTTVYEAHYGMTQEWAVALLSLGYDPALPLSFDRSSGDVDTTLAELAAAPAGTAQETFHFALNNIVIKDNRIPPFGMRYDDARVRNALPVPASQYGAPGAGGTYDHFDRIALEPPAEAEYAEIELLYQPTSWEYIQFLYLANNRSNPFLADEGLNMLEAWQSTGMAAPHVMAATTWGNAPVPATPDVRVDTLTTWSVDKRGKLVTPSATFSRGDTVAIIAHVVDGGDQDVLGAQVFLDVSGPGGPEVSLQGFSDEAGNAVLKWKTNRKQAFGIYVCYLFDLVINGYVFDLAGSAPLISLTIE
jgi:hypothetical protein